MILSNVFETTSRAIDFVFGNHFELEPGHTVEDQNDRSSIIYCAGGTRLIRSANEIESSVTCLLATRAVLYDTSFRASVGVRYQGITWMPKPIEHFTDNN